MATGRFHGAYATVHEHNAKLRSISMHGRLIYPLSKDVAEPLFADSTNLPGGRIVGGIVR
jgi:hypothetical protein